MDQTTLTAPSSTQTDYQESDIFQWANNIFMYKEQLSMELFLMNKNYLLYRTQYSQALARQLQPLFIDGLLEFVNTGATKGLVVRGFEEAEGEENVLQRTKVARVDKLVEAMSWLGSQEMQMESFVEQDHDLKRMRAVIARCKHPEFPKSFYIIKQLASSQILKGAGAWTISGTQFAALDDGAALRIPADNHLLIIDQDLYVFNQSKLERLFGYNAKKHAVAEKKVAQIEANFNLSFADELDLQTMVKGSKTTISKLQKLDPTAITQEELLNHAEELGIEMMQDDSGAIIIMNNKDLTTFVNLLNDDYVESPLTGNRYEIKSKKPLKAPKDTNAV